MKRKKYLLYPSIALILCLFSVQFASASGLVPKGFASQMLDNNKAAAPTDGITVKAAKSDSAKTQNTPPVNQANSSIKIDTKVIALTGTIATKTTNDGMGYILNTTDSSFAVIGPDVKALSAYANTDKKITVTGNPAVGANIIVMVSFAEYVPPTAPATPGASTTPGTPATPGTPGTPGTPDTPGTPGAPTPPTPQNPPVAIKIDNKVISLTGTITSVPTNDGVGYKLNAPEGSYAVIGPNAKALSTYADTDKKLTITGNPAVGANIILMQSFVEYTPPTPPTPPTPQPPPISIRIDSKVISLTGTITTKPTNDGVAYMLNTADGSFAVIGPSAKTLSAYANTDKQITVTGNPAIGYNIIVLLSFTL